ncbi:MAG: twin-arginine translocation signal domain-containing protein [Nitrososphaerales archaeon]
MTNIQSDKQNRRDFIKYVGGAAVGLGIGGLGFINSNSNLSAEKEISSKLQTDVANLNDRLEYLQRWAIFGGGSNIKNMPNTVDKQPTVRIDETFYFDQKNAICRVDNNPEAFIMPTYQMGEIEIEKNTFFMLMSTTSLHVKSIEESENSTCILESDIGDCFTEAAAGGNIYGSRIKPEPFTSEIVAVDGKAFSYTAYFDENEAPINYAIFGPKFTFTGELTTGSVTVKKLEKLAKSLPK